MSSEDPLLFQKSGAWESWLESHHETTSGVWLRFAKVKSGKKSMAYVDAIEVALCFGWIDALRRSEGPEYYLQRFTPRKPRSVWSLINRERVLALVAAGKMRPAGLREIARAKANGRWSAAYAGPSSIQVPTDLANALEVNPNAKAMFAQLNGQNRYAVLLRLQMALKPETRARRLDKFVTMLNRGETVYPQPKARPDKA